MATQWLQNSLSHLRKAEKIGEQTNSLLLYTRKALRKRDYSASRSCFLLDALRQQRESLDVVTQSIGMLAVKYDTQLDALESDLADSVAQLGDAYAELKSIRVPPSLRDATLRDFVSDDMVQVLKEKQSSVKQGRQLISSMQRDHKRLKQLHLEIPDDPDESSTLLATIQEVQEIEEEIATILESLTSHYDLCLKAVAVEKGEVSMGTLEKDELFSVLAKDDKELPDILTEIEDCFHELKQRCDSIHVDSTLYDSIVEKMAEVKESGQVLNRTMHSMENVTAQLNKLVYGIKESCEESHGLCVSYSRFRESFGEFLAEIKRRVETQKRMNKIIQDAESRLSILAREDSRQRQLFLETHGDSLPMDLWRTLPHDELVSLTVVQSQLPQI